MSNFKNFKFAKLETTDRFSQMCQEHFEAAKQTNPQARFEDSLQFVSRTWPRLYIEHVRRTAGESGL